MNLSTIFIIGATIGIIQFYQRADQIIAARQKITNNNEDWWNVPRLRVAGFILYAVIVIASLLDLY